MSEVATAATVDPDVFKDVLQAAVVQCQQSLVELQVQHSKQQHQALQELMARLAGALAERIISPKSQDFDSGENTPTLASALLGPGSRILSTDTSDAWVVETMLPNGAKFRTTEPPEMEAAAYKPVPDLPKLDMDIIQRENPGILTPDGHVAAMQERMNLSPTMSVSASSCISDQDASHVAFELDGGACSILSDDSSEEKKLHRPSMMESAGECQIHVQIAQPTDPTDTVSLESCQAQAPLSPAAETPPRSSAGSRAEAAAALLVIAGAAAAGADASFRAAGESAPAGLRAAQVLVAASFTAEFVARALAMGGARAAVRSPWILLDALVLAGSWAHVGLQLLTGSLALLGALPVLRLTRLPRWAWRQAFDPAREAPLFGMQGAFACALPAFYVAVVSFVGLLYSWAVLGLVFIRPSPDFGEEYEAAANAHFGSFGRSLLTLSSALTMDGISAVYTPLISARPSLALYFGALMLSALLAAFGLASALGAEVLAWRARLAEKQEPQDEAPESAESPPSSEQAQLAERLQAIEESIKRLSVYPFAQPPLLFPKMDKGLIGNDPDTYAI